MPYEIFFVRILRENEIWSLICKALDKNGNIPETTTTTTKTLLDMQ